MSLEYIYIEGDLAADNRVPKPEHRWEQILNDLGAVSSHVTVAWSDAEAEQQHHK